MDNIQAQRQTSPPPNLANLLKTCHIEGKKFQDVAQKSGLAFKAPEKGETNVIGLSRKPFHWPSGPGDISAYVDTAPSPQKWFADERLLANRGHLLTSVGGTGKTTLLYQLAVAAVVGHLPWGWKINSTGAALLILAEDDRNNVHRVISAISKELSEAENEMLRKGLSIHPMAGQSCILLSQSGNRLTETDRAQGLMELAKRTEDLRFIGLDTAIALTEGRELEPSDQRRLGEFVDKLALETGACVVMTTHAAKSLRSQDELETHSSRGSGAITDVLRSEITLRTMVDKEATKFGINRDDRRRFVKLALTKANSAPLDAYKPIWLERTDKGLFRGVEFGSDKPGISKRALDALNLLSDLNAEGVEVSMKAWREQCILNGLIAEGKPDSQAKVMQRLKDELSSSKLIKDGSKRGTYLPNNSSDCLI